MKIYLVRHGMSRANVDWSENRRVADHAIELTEEGKRQAREAGKFLADYFFEHLAVGQPWKSPLIRLWHSPYLRTMQTATEIVGACRLPKPDSASGERVTWSFGPVYGPRQHDEPRLTRRDGDSWFMDPGEADPLKHPVAHGRLHFLLHEQQFGIFDGLSDEERRELYPAETEYYEKCKRFEGKVWAKLPMGESRMDVVGRMHQAFGSFKRDEEKHDIENIVVVGHGTTNRCFTMAWLHYAPAWLEKERNPRNCSIRLIEDGVDRGYIFDGFENPPGYEHKVNRESEE